MNLPNKLSIVRVACIPVIVILLYQHSDACRIIAGSLFIIASLTDFLDGYIARKYNLVTNFGKFIDPVADKLTQGALLICLIPRYKLIIALVVVFVIREAIMFFAGLKVKLVTDKLQSADHIHEDSAHGREHPYRRVHSVGGRLADPLPCRVQEGSCGRRESRAGREPGREPGSKPRREHGS